MNSRIDRARDLRQNSTDVERILWHRLRDRRIGGCKFRRQQPIGGYIVDFVCLERRLIIELDGGQHAVDAARDALRDRWLAAEGHRVIRFWNNEIAENLESVLQRIEIELAAGDPSPQPSPPRGEGD